jgi:hypothetical protein
LGHTLKPGVRFLFLSLARRGAGRKKNANEEGDRISLFVFFGTLVCLCDLLLMVSSHEDTKVTKKNTKEDWKKENIPIPLLRDLRDFV